MKYSSLHSILLKFMYFKQFNDLQQLREKCILSIISLVIF